MRVVVRYEPRYPSTPVQKKPLAVAGPDYDRLVEEFIAAAVAEPAERVIGAVGLGRRLVRDWEYETKWGMRQVPEPSWRPLLDAAAALPHTGQHRDGLRACLRLIGAHWLDEDVRTQAYDCLTDYAEALTTLWPDASWQPLASPDGENATMLSPSPVAVPDGLLAAVQTSDANGEATWCLLTLDRDTCVRAITTVRDETYAAAPAAVAPVPIEQLQPIISEGQLHALVTVRDRNPRGVAQAGLAAIQDGALRGLRLLSDPANGRHERRWAPFLAGADLHAVSWWEPTEVQRLDGEAGTARRTALRPAPRLAERFLGASAGVSVAGGWLFLVNEPAGASEDGPMAFARFVFMRSDFVVTAVSPHFWVETRGEDRASGLTRLGDELIAGFTRCERGAMLARNPVSAVLDSLLPLAAPGAAAPGE